MEHTKLREFDFGKYKKSVRNIRCGESEPIHDVDDMMLEECSGLNTWSEFDVDSSYRHVIDQLI